MVLPHLRKHYLWSAGGEALSLQKGWASLVLAKILFEVGKRDFGGQAVLCETVRSGHRLRESASL